MRPYFLHTFEKMTVIHSDQLKQVDDLQKMIERVKPDAVVVEIVARKL
jgi:formate-dependent phosphoribosylglycinamide formyltransferase (GAR transformylase)